MRRVTRARRALSKLGRAGAFLLLTPVTLGCEKPSPLSREQPSGADSVEEKRAEGSSGREPDATAAPPGSDGAQGRAPEAQTPPGEGSPALSGSPSVTSSSTSSSSTSTSSSSTSTSSSSTSTSSSSTLSSPGGPPPTSSRVTSGGSPPPHTFAPLGASAAALACSSDADCVVSCYTDGRCCEELCGCSRVYHRTFAASLAAAVKANCSPNVVCPVARCQGTKKAQAACEEGKCVLVRGKNE
jgi:hypothetical protein